MRLIRRLKRINNRAINKKNRSRSKLRFFIYYLVMRHSSKQTAKNKLKKNWTFFVHFKINCIFGQILTK